MPLRATHGANVKRPEFELAAQELPEEPVTLDMVRHGESWVKGAGSGLTRRHSLSIHSGTLWQLVFSN